MSYRTGTIESITLKDDDVNEIYSVQVYSGDGFTVTAYPLDSNISRIPICSWFSF